MRPLHIKFFLRDHRGDKYDYSLRTAIEKLSMMYGTNVVEGVCLEMKCEPQRKSSPIENPHEVPYDPKDTFRF